MPYLQSQLFVGFIDGSIPCLDKLIALTMMSSAMQIVNPEYLAKYQHNQVMLGALLSSFFEEVLSQVLFLTSSA